MVEVALRDEDNAYDINGGTAIADDKICATQVEGALKTVFGSRAEQTLTIIALSQAEVDLHFGIYARLLARKLEGVLGIQGSGRGRRRNVRPRRVKCFGGKRDGPFLAG